MVDSVKVAEFGDSGVVVEVYHKYVGSAQKVFFDVVCATECVEGTARYFSPFTRVPNIPLMVMSVVEAMTYISERHKEMRDGDGAREVPEMSGSSCSGLKELEPSAVMQDVTSLKEFSKGSVVAELVATEEGEVTSFSVCCWREYVNGAGDREREFFIQQRDLRDLIIVLLRAWMYVRDNWGDSTSASARRW